MRGAVWDCSGRSPFKPVVEIGVVIVNVADAAIIIPPILEKVSVAAREIAATAGGFMRGRGSALS